MVGVVGTNLVALVGFIVRDIEETKRKWAAFLGMEVPETQPCGDYQVTQTVFEGKPAPEADALLAFFDVGPGMQIELIQPNEAPSTWRNFLNEPRFVPYVLVAPFILFLAVVYLYPLIMTVIMSFQKIGMRIMSCKKSKISANCGKYGRV